MRELLLSRVLFCRKGYYKKRALSFSLHTHTQNEQITIPQAPAISYFIFPCAKMKENVLVAGVVAVVLQNSNSQKAAAASS